IEISGPVDVSGSTVKVDNSAFVEKYLANARRAYNKEDWEEVEKYYNMVEQNVPNNMEAVFFSAFGKTMLSFTDNNYFKRQQQFHVLNNSISVINDYFEVTTENREEVLRKIASAIIKMDHITFVYDLNQLSYNIGSLKWQKNLINTTKRAFITELDQIAAIHDDSYIKELKETIENQLSSGGCYVATCVYGSYDCPQVWTLRRYRDNTLAETWYGRAFIHIYYKVSPTIVKLFGKTKWFKALWKNKLDKMVDKLKLNGVEDTPYEDKEW
ncbi:MAG: hypothetical protein K6D98_03910, partial [Clostridiales bacterium]|nr:hypothetical protein [Clostridiales bacterium]